MVVEREVLREICEDKGELVVFLDIGMGLLVEEVENVVKSCDRVWIKVSWDQVVIYRF